VIPALVTLSKKAIMKKYISGALLLLASSLTSYAQQSNQTLYKLPDGKIIGHDRLDSDNAAWGNRGFLMTHNDSDTAMIRVSPMTEAYLKQMADNEANLKALLNKPAPNFTLTDLSGKKWVLSTLKGRTVVLNFWFTTCVGCIQEMPELNELQKTYAKSSTVFLALGLDDAKATKRFVTGHPFNYTLLPKSKAVSDLYHVSAYPTSIVIDPKGVIRLQQVGGKNIKAEIIAAINNTNKI
jgi:peroxiredoxin